MSPVAHLAVVRRRLRWRVVAPAAAALRRGLSRLGGGWPLRLGRRPPPPAPGPPRLAYYHHAFPVLSETFIQREVAALRRAGLDVTVLAHAAQGVEQFDDAARALQATTVYLPLPAPTGMPPGVGALLRRHPLRVASGALWLLLRSHQVRKSWRRDRRLFARAVQLAGELRARRLTHVHSPWASPDATVALLAARWADVPYSLQARASDIHRHGAEHGLDERLAHAAFVVTNTRYNAARLRELLPARGAPSLHVVHNGIEPARFAAPPRAGAGGDVPRLLCVGRLTEPKGIDDLLRACARLRDSGVPFACEIVGGRLADEVNHYLHLRKLHRALGLAGAVRFVGPQPFARVLGRYAAADIVVLPAVQARDGRREVTPNVLLEAMAMGCAVVSTPVGGIPELVEDGVSGLLVPPRDPVALAAALARLGADAALRARLGAEARRRVVERFDIARTAQALHALFTGAGGDASRAL